MPMKHAAGRAAAGARGIYDRLNRAAADSDRGAAMARAEALPAPSLAGALRRGVWPLLVLLALGYFMADDLAALDPAAIWHGARAMDPATWALALAGTALSFFAVARYELAVLAAQGQRPASRAGQRRAMAAGTAAVALAQTTGGGLVVAALMRWRCLPGTTLTGAARITLGAALGFMAGLALLAGAALLWGGGYPLWAEAAALSGLLALAALVGLRLWHPRIRALPRLPALPALALAGVWLVIDLLGAGLAFWAFCPEMALNVLVPAYLLALLAGLLAGTPGGLGAFEGVLLATLPAALPAGETAALAAAVICYRSAYYLLPAALAALYAALAPTLAGEASVPRARLSRPQPGALTRLPRCDAQLALLPGGWLLEDAGGRPLAAARRLPLALATLGHLPLSPEARPLDRLTAAASADGRLPLAYRIGPKLAARARSQGWAVWRCGHEAVLNPAEWSPDRQGLGSLRRKLRKAEKAGLVLRPAEAPLPRAEMARIDAAWRARNGAARGVTMGCLASAPLSRQRVFVAELAGRPVAFVSFQACTGEWALDLMRQDESAPDGTMIWLVAAALAAAREAGIPRLSLACAPGFGGRIGAALDARMGCKGLWQFKNGFAPAWEPRYMAAPSRPALALAGADLLRAIATGR